MCSPGSTAATGWRRAWSRRCATWRYRSRWSCGWRGPMWRTAAAASLILVPAPFCADAIMEAADAGIRLVVTITDGVPAQDMIRVKRYLWRYAKERRTTLIGPNCAGIISAGRAMMGIMPGHIYTRGSVGVVTRSGTL